MLSTAAAVAVAGLLNGAVVPENPRQTFSTTAAASNLSAPSIPRRCVAAVAYCAAAGVGALRCTPVSIIKSSILGT
jgi:hypothetical protein